MKQLKLSIGDCPKREHGGSLHIGRRRTRRPLSTKEPIHLVLKSDFATGARQITRHRQIVERILKKASRLYHIRIYDKGVAWNHIHLVILGKRRIDIQNFFRVVAGHIAQEILVKHPIKEHETGTAPRDPENKFWQTRIYSRLVSWGRELEAVLNYVRQNALEAVGAIPYKQRKVRRKNSS